VNIQIGFTETTRYERIAVFEIPAEGVDTTTVENLCDYIDRNCQAPGDVAIAIEKFVPGAKIVHYPDTDYSSPYSADLEVTEWDEVAAQTEPE